jgi:hypothetical protein
MLSSVSLAWMIICLQPAGGRHEEGGVTVLVNVGVMLGVGDSSPRVGVSVGGKVNVAVGVKVAVKGTGEENRISVAVGVACGTNSTSEMDNAPTINPIEIKATTSALPKPRKRIISFL